MRYAVTGGAGFIGSNMVEELLRQGHSVTVLDDLSTGDEKNLAAVRDRIDFINGSVLDRDTVDRACRGADYVLHLAARTSVAHSVKDPLETHHVNVDGTLQVLLAARDAGVRRVVFPGSCAVYGDEPTLPKREDMPPAPISPYGVTKVIGELYGQTFHRVYGLEFVSVRYFNVFGPRQDPRSAYSGVLSVFCSAMRDAVQPTVFGDGEQSRDFVYVDNVVQGTILACETPGIAGTVFNLGMGNRHTLNQTLRLLEKFSGRPANAKYLPARPGDICHSQADISRAQQKLGFQPQVSFEEGLRRTYDWYSVSR